LSACQAMYDRLRHQFWIEGRRRIMAAKSNKK
jgi:hypothetical protein